MAMSVIGAGPDEDRTRFIRLSLVIIDELTPILRDLLHNEIQPKDICIKATKLDLPNVRAGQSILLSNAKIEGYKNFDTTLLYTLLRNACPNIPPPTQQWGGVHEMPLPNEITVGDDIERIRLIRNKVLAHIPEAAIQEKEFQEYWSTISDICTRMQTLLKKDYINRLQKAVECTIDSDKEKMYIDKIKRIAEEEKSLKDLVLTILAKLGTHAIAFLRSYRTFTSFYII